MRVDELRAEMETELSSRFDEIRRLRNLLQSADDRDCIAIRRALVVLLYAHYEGFAKFCLIIYLRYIRQFTLACSEASPQLVALSWSSIFSGLSMPVKNKYFKKSLPDDTKLHSFSRQVEFIEGISSATALPVTVSDNAIDLESNLSPIVLRKNLYILGLDYSFVELMEKDVAKLVRWRHNIAHGGSKYEVNEVGLQSVWSAAKSVSELLMEELTGAMIREDFRRIE